MKTKRVGKSEGNEDGGSEKRVGLGVPPILTLFEVI